MTVSLRRAEAQAAYAEIVATMRVGRWRILRLLTEPGWIGSRLEFDVEVEASSAVSRG